MARTQLTPAENYTAACNTMTFTELLNWIWKTRIKNGLMVAKRRGQDEAVITVVDRYGSKLCALDKRVREKIHERLKTEGYVFEEIWSGTENTTQSKVAISPLTSAKAA